MDGSSVVFGLTGIVNDYVEDGYIIRGAETFHAPPGSANTVVEVDDLRIRPVNSVYHTRDGSTTQFATPQTCAEGNIVNTGSISVAIIQKSDGITLSAPVLSPKHKTHKCKHNSYLHCYLIHL